MKNYPAKIIILLLTAILVLVSVTFSPIFTEAQSLHASWSLGFGILENPVDVAVCGGDVFVSDKGLKSIVKLDTQGKKISELKTVEGKNISPAGICISDDSILYVADTANDRVIILTPNFDVINILEAGALKITKPVDVAVGNFSYIYVLSEADRKISVLNFHGEFVRAVASPGVLSGQLASPKGLSVLGERIAVADLGAGKAKIFAPFTGEEKSYGIPGTYPSSLSGPVDTTWDKVGNLYVVDRNNNDIVIFPATGLEPFSWGRYGRPGTAVNFFYTDMEPVDFSSAPGRLCRPAGITIDGDCIYIADSGNARIVVVSFDEVWKIPRIPDFFAKQKPDVPKAIVSPEVLDFGVVGKSLTKTVSLQFTSCPGSIGSAYIRGDNNIQVEPTVFLGSNIKFHVTVNNNTQPLNLRATLVIQSVGKTFEVKITGKRGKQPGIVFTSNTDSEAIMASEGAFVTLELKSQNGFAGEVSLTCSNPVYSPPWARPAKDVDEIQLGTVGMAFTKPVVKLEGNSAVKTFLNIFESGRLRSGLYTFDVKAVSNSNPNASVVHTVTLFITSIATENIMGTVLYETFTAHWCNPCGFHREAGYRMVEEHGRRNIIPVAYHVMDKNDETGMTTDVNFSRFKLYEGTGLPLSVMNGRILTVAGASEHTARFAPDKISGRRYSGTTFEYWKLRAELNSTYRTNPLVLQFSAGLEDKSDTGSLFLRVAKNDYHKGREARVYFLLVEDGIEYFADNGEFQHNAVVRDILHPVGSAEIFSPVNLGRKREISFEFKISEMPSDFQLVRENLSIVAFVADEKTKKILGVHWYDLPAPTDCSSELFTSGDKTINRGTRSRVSVHLSNTGTCVQSFVMDTKKSHETINIELTETGFTIAPGETQTALMYLSTKSDINSSDDVFIDIIATDAEGEVLEYRLQLGSN